MKQIYAVIVILTFTFKNVAAINKTLLVFFIYLYFQLIALFYGIKESCLYNKNKLKLKLKKKSSLKYLIPDLLLYKLNLYLIKIKFFNFFLYILFSRLCLIRFKKIICM